MQRILKICQQSSSGSELLEEQLVNSGAHKIAIYFNTHVFTRILSGVRAFSADLHEQIAATRFIWTMVILRSIEASGPLLNGFRFHFHFHRSWFYHFPWNTQVLTNVMLHLIGPLLSIFSHRIWGWAVQCCSTCWNDDRFFFGYNLLLRLSLQFTNTIGLQILRRYWSIATAISNARWTWR